MNDEAFITDFRYLSINRIWFDNTKQKTIVVEGHTYNIDILRPIISYRDNRDFYRWKPGVYRRADVS